MYKLERRRKGGNWHVCFYYKSKRVRKSCRTKIKELAKEYAEKFYSDFYRAARLGSKAHYTFEDGVMIYLQHKEVKSLDDIKRHIRVLDQWLAKVRLSDINRAMVEYIKTERKKQYKQTRCKVDGVWTTRDTKEHVSNASVNRMLEVLRSILFACKEHEILEHVPTFKMLPEDKERIRWLTKQEADRLLLELPSHLALMALLSLLTGLREQNITSLKWSQVDLDRKMLSISAKDMKTMEALNVPLNQEACELLDALKCSQNTYVFYYRKKPIRNANTKAFKSALKRAGIEDFRWHDLRHTWASWHIQAGTPLESLMKLGGWSSLEMVLRYAHLGKQHYAEHAENITDTFTDQTEKDKT